MIKLPEERKIQDVRNVPLEVGKLYEYVCKWQRPMPC